MPRPFNPHLSKDWKVTMNAPLAGRVELALWDRVHKKPSYGGRKIVIEELLELWLEGKTPTVSIQPQSDIEDVF